MAGQASPTHRALVSPTPRDDPAVHEAYRLQHAAGSSPYGTGEDYLRYHHDPHALQGFRRPSRHVSPEAGSHTPPPASPPHGAVPAAMYYNGIIPSPPLPPPPAPADALHLAAFEARVAAEAAAEKLPAPLPAPPQPYPVGSVSPRVAVASVVHDPHVAQAAATAAASAAAAEAAAVAASASSAIPVPLDALRAAGTPPPTPGDQNRLFALEADVQNLTQTLEALRKQMSNGKASSAAKAVPPVAPPQPPQAKPAPATSKHRSGSGMGSSAARSSSLTRGGVLSGGGTSSASSTYGTMSLVPHEYSIEEASAVTERLSRAMRAIRLMTGPEVARLADYVHPPADILPYVKLLVLLLKLGHKKNLLTWPNDDLRSDRKELWGSGWRELLPALKTKKLADRLSGLSVLSARNVVEETPHDVQFLMEHYLVADEADSRLGKISFAALALAEFLHAYYGVWKLQKGVRSQLAAPPQGGGGGQARVGRNRGRSATPVKKVLSPAGKRIGDANIGSGRRADSSSRRTEGSAAGGLSTPRGRPHAAVRSGSARSKRQVISPPVPRDVRRSEYEVMPAHETAAGVAGAPISPLAMSMPVSVPLPAASLPHEVPLAGGAPMAGGNFAAVSSWLSSQGLSQYFAVFLANEIDFEALGLLTDKDLQDMGIPIGPKKKLMRSLRSKDHEKF